MEVVKYEKVIDSNSVKAIVSFYIKEWKLHLHDCKLIHTSKGAKFISLPSKRSEENGVITYTPYIQFDNDILKSFQASANEAINSYLEANHQI